MSALKTLSFCFTLLYLTGEFAAAANPQAGVSTAAGKYFGGSNTFMPYQPARRPAPEEITRGDKSYAFITPCRLWAGRYIGGVRPVCRPGDPSSAPGVPHAR